MSPSNNDSNLQVPKQSRAHNIWHEWRGFVLFIGIMLVFRSAIADWNQVPSGSMIPSILKGDRIVVDKLAYDLRVPFTLQRVARWSDPERSDIITFESPEDGKLLVKRVIGVPGDIVVLKENHLSVNGEPAHYSEVDRAVLPSPVVTTLDRADVAYEEVLGSTRTIMLHKQRHAEIRASYGPVKVPAGHYLVLGDNRDNSQDSRVIGLVSRDSILGKANKIAFSLDYDNYYLPRGNRFFRDLK